jgi:anthranilate phosphoribosyltransferase
MLMTLEKVIRGGDLSAAEAAALMEGMMDGSLGQARAAAMLVALRMKGESAEELASFARVMRKHAVIIRPRAGCLVDTCGTGGDGSGTFNISTTAAFIAAGAGVAIAKHGNRAVSGRCGSADALEALGVRLLGPEAARDCIESNGIGFLYAPLFHPAMKAVMPLRKELGVRTAFNMLGPLSNPANAAAQVLGVYAPAMTKVMAEALRQLGCRRALVVHSEGMDELGLGMSAVSELKCGKLSEYGLDASSLGFRKAGIPRASSKEESARIILSVLSGDGGPARDISALNAAAAIYVSGEADSMAAAVEAALGSIDSGAAMDKLAALRAFGG